MTRAVNSLSLRFSVLATALSLAVGACGSGSDSNTSSRPAEQPPVVSRAPTPSDSACPRDGLWKACALEDRVNKAGMPVQVVDTLQLPYFSEPGIHYHIGRNMGMVAIFFADSLSGVKATAGLDRHSLTAPGESPGPWPAVPKEVVRSANLIAVLFNVTETQAERLRLAITAGAPQPPRSTPPVLPSVKSGRQDQTVLQPPR